GGHVSGCIAFFVEGAVAGMKNSTGNEFIGGEKIRQQAAPRTIELFKGPDEEMPIELVGASEVDDMDCIDALAVRRAIEPHRVVADVLVDMLIRLQCETGVVRGLLSLKGIVRIVVNRIASERASVQGEPS